jgi:hypothetical protein
MKSSFGTTNNRKIISIKIYIGDKKMLEISKEDLEFLKKECPDTIALLEQDDIRKYLK